MRKLLILLILLMIPVNCLTEEAWILCQPKSYVVCHEAPKKGSPVAGYLYCGDKVEVIGKSRNGYVKLAVNFEQSVGYVYKGYIIYDEPVEVNEPRVITMDKIRARRFVNGPKRRWLNTGDTITVFWESPTWAVTSQGYVKTDLTGDYDP